jgi:hypothetical protein
VPKRVVFSPTDAFVGPPESTFLIAYNLAPSLVSTSSLSSAPHLGASLDPSTTTSAASPDASAAAALLAAAQSTATPAAARTPFAAALGGAAGTALAGDGDEGKGKGQVRFCEVRISLGGEETEEVCELQHFAPCARPSAPLPGGRE